MGWSPSTRSITRSRATPSAARPSTRYPNASGPRWASVCTIRSSTARSAGCPAGAKKPAMPHLASAVGRGEGGGGRQAAVRRQRNEADADPGGFAQAAHQAERHSGRGAETEGGEERDVPALERTETRRHHERRE